MCMLVESFILHVNINIQMLHRSFAALAFYDPDNGSISRPSELLRSVSVTKHRLHLEYLFALIYYSIKNLP